MLAAPRHSLLESCKYVSVHEGLKMLNKGLFTMKQDREEQTIITGAMFLYGLCYSRYRQMVPRVHRPSEIIHAVSDPLRLSPYYALRSP